MYVQPPGFALNTAYQTSRSRLEKSMARLSTGDRFANAGDANGGELSMAQRFKNQVRRAEASTQALQTGLTFLNAADGYAQTVMNILHRMTEIAAVGSDSQKTSGDREALDVEFQVLKSEIAGMVRTTSFNGRQAISRDVMVSYDSNSERVRFFTPGGSEAGEITRDFGSTDTDINGTAIGFDSGEDYSMSRDGKSLYFLGTVAGDGAGVVRMKRYDIESQTVYTGSDLFATGDTLFVDEGGDVFVNGSGTINTVDKGTLSATATGITNASTGTEFSVYKDAVQYHRTSDNNFVSYDLNSTVATSLTGALAWGAGEHSLAASGKYAAEESPAGSIRVIDTRSGNEATIAIGAANAVTDLHFNEDGDRVYYVNQVTNSINYVTVNSDENGNVSLTDGGKVVQGTRANAFSGLDMGGAGFGSTIDITVAQDSISRIQYEAIDVNTYILGIANTHVDTFTAANDALEDIKEAINRLSFRRAKLGAQASRLDHVLNGHRNFITDISNAQSQIADVDIAAESMVFSASQVRNQTASAILAQFNTIQRNVLSLLQF